MKNSRTPLRKAMGALALAAVLVLPSVSAAVSDGGLGSSVTDLRVGVHPDHTRIVIETDGKAPFVVDPTDREVIVHVDAAATAEAGWRGFRAGKRLVVPRCIDRFSVLVCRLVPAGAIARFVAAMQRPR